MASPPSQSTAQIGAHHQPSHRRWWTENRTFQVFVLGSITLALTLVSVAWRWPTLHQANYLRFAAGHLSYSDVIADYAVWRGSAHPIPYVQQQVDYPVIIGLAMWAAEFAPGVEGYFLAASALIVASLLLCFVVLTWFRPRASLARFALAPGLATYAALNWDGLAMLGLLGALYATERRRFGWAGIWLGLGTAAKLFPGFVFPILLMQSLRTEPAKAAAADGGGSLRRFITPAAVRFTIAFLVVNLVPNLPFALVNFRLWVYPYVYRVTYEINPDSFWAGIPNVSNLMVSIFFAIVFIGGTIWISLAVLQNGRWRAGSLLVLLLFCLFTKAFSPQYDLWLVPLLALLICPWRLWLAFVVADFAYYAAIFFFWFTYTGGQPPIFGTISADLLRTSVWGRELVFAALFAWGVAALYGMSATEGWKWLTEFLDTKSAEYLARYPTPDHDRDQ